MAKKITRTSVRNELKIFWDEIEKIRDDIINYAEKKLKYRKDQMFFYSIADHMDASKKQLANFQYRVNDSKDRLDELFKE